MRKTESSECTGRGTLMDRITHSDNLNNAYKRVKRNKGAPGIDGMTLEQLALYLKEQGETVRSCLQQGKWQPSPVRKVMIPKPDGGERQLGIPTVLDRLAQQAIQQILQEDWDTNFSPYSYGFRPKRSAHHALFQAKQYIRKGYDWIVDIDLSKFFDRVNHDRLMSTLAQYTDDKEALRLIRRFLTSGVMEEGVLSKSTVGTPQGGPLSPVLSNIVLDELDRELDRRGLRYVRYADDYRIFVKSYRAGQRVLESLTRFIEGQMKLKVNVEKSGVARPWEHSFLGYIFSKKGEFVISPKAIKKFKREVKQLTKKHGCSLMQRLTRLNMYLRGWQQYFSLVRPIYFRDFDKWIRRRLRCLMWFQWKTAKRRFKELVSRGASRRAAAQMAASSKKYWRMSCTPTLSRALSNSWFVDIGLQRLSLT
ncbi:group II intron reverse transcriptase/maturase [Photobacterium carnosum]|nr:group II intron reverse transcriptase/maturase [Photobacterium carnosum]MCD9528348.1 group II intron reverse transcriptase/maturase [Photobacterium carnosum]